jgi:hypothetical protein
MADKVVLSGPLKVDLAVYRGDSGQFKITVSDYLGAPADVSTATWVGEIRDKTDDTIVVTTFDITPTPGDTASVDVKLTPVKSALLNSACVYDIQMTLSGNVTTLVNGAITVTADVSRP